jgi:predicted transcriptional regulator
MRRTTISLPDDVAAALEREARRRRMPVSQVAREAIETRLGWNEEGPREIPFAGIGGSGDGELTNLAAESEDYLREHWADDIYRDAFNRDP